MARGSVRKRGSTWTVVLDVGPDPVTGPPPAEVRRRFPHEEGRRGRVARAVGERGCRGKYVERSTRTVGDYLDEWLEVVRPRLRPTSMNSYRQAVEHI